MKKSIIIALIVIGTLVGIVLLDTIQARIFKNSPIISLQEKLEGDSYVDKGLLIDTYYCVKEQDIVTVSWHFKNAKFTCPIEDSPKDTNNSDKDPLVDCLMGRLGAYITSESRWPHEIGLNELIDVDMEKVDYSLVQITDNIGIYIIIKTSDSDIISKLEAYLGKEYAHYKSSIVNDYNVYVYTPSFNSEDNYTGLFEYDMNYCRNK